MKTVIGLAALSLAVAGSASAASPRYVSDVDFLKANRCKGIAEGMGADTAALTAFIHDQGRPRLGVILDKGTELAQHAKRQAADANMKDKLSAELAGGCTAFMAGSGTTVAAGSGNSAVSAH